MTRRRAAIATPEKPAPTTLFDTSPASKQPFTWGRVPSRDEALVIAGQSGVWSYAGAMECGPFEQYVLLVRYSERLNAPAPRGWLRPPGGCWKTEKRGYGDE